MRRMFLSAIALVWSGLAMAQQPPIIIGLSSANTGGAAIATERERWGVNLALEEINAAGGVLGRRLEVMPVDNRCNPAEAVNAANRLIEARVPVIIGAHCSSATLATMPLIMQAQIPLVTTIASSPRITELSGVGGNPWTFRLNPGDDHMMLALGRYIATRRPFSRVSIIAEDSDFGRGGIEMFVPQMRQAGVEVLSTDIYPMGLPDYTSILTRVQQRRPEAIALFQVGGDQVNFLRQAMQLGIRIPYTGRAELGGENVQFITAGGMEGSISAWNYSHEVNTPENRAFAQRIFQRHNLQPVLQVWAGYDSVRMIAQAIREANSAEPARIRDALQAIRFRTVMGETVNFDRNNQAGKVVVIQAVRNRQIVIAELVRID